jgi:hypothetical protein
MKLITDTFILKSHFREVVADPNYVALQCEPHQLEYILLHIREWARELEAEIASRGG